MINTVIFDLDGTLLYTLEDLTDSLNHALSEIGCEEKTINEVRNFVGNGVKKLVERATPNGTSHLRFEECLCIFKEHYTKNMYNKTRPYNGVAEMLDLLKENGYKTAVVSNKFDHAVKELCTRYFGDKIQFAVGENEIIKKKPAPDGVLEAIKKTGCTQENCVYVGDSEVDIETANNAGMPCISVDWGYKDKDFLLANGAKNIVSTPQELLELIKKL